MKDPNSPTAQRRLQTRIREQDAFKMRISGATFQQIGDSLGISRQAAHKIVMKLLLQTRTATAELLEDARRLEAERLDRLQVGLWNKASAGDPRVADTIIRIMERRARMLGLDVQPDEAPKLPVEITVVDKTSHDPS